ncbi:4-hydroxybenzoate octaprenyltransferase [Sphingomonas nostoxanthinifaciens]|uniref:4-hydroxybenzoate octaprenyltransferase n=1 Tax=Sphingomonas nostoxanthinifaciens TaxID=2872652 RepID=UPI001CC205D3|nr:4-hydroxybenzoate octaprenyltransferase [Sphingomonas nostoxanthinifaciens]UAK23991.1 4-hydroxybenzoate octaprenyltransferase [Sphingomonas nostoxanthinifaciens]
MTSSPDTIVPDSERRGLVAALPAAVRPFYLLARFDRPIGGWLLFWPGAWAIALAGAAVARWDLLVLIGVGAVAMRGAGCVYNDIVDRDLDARVARTRDRPLASGRISLKAAWAFLLGLCLIGLAVLLCLDRTAQIVALASIAPVAAYPFMKRITWWPQAWLGIVFSWAALVGWPAATGTLAAPMAWLYAGAIAWVVGYDTIYALQDIEDDALAGVKSSARALGAHARGGIALFYVVALALWARALWLVRPEPLALAALLPMALHLGWQVAGLRVADPVDALRRFRSNRFAGLLMALACLVVGSASVL